MAWKWGKREVIPKHSVRDREGRSDGGARPILPRRGTIRLSTNAAPGGRRAPPGPFDRPHHQQIVPLPLSSPPRPLTRWLYRARLAAAVAFVVATSAASGASAATSLPARTEDAASARHTKLARSAPSAGETLAASPRTIRLWFTKPVTARLTRVQLKCETGQVMAVDSVRAVGTGNTVVEAPLKAQLRPGSYTVNWVTTSRDSHVIKGSYTFRVQGSSTLD